MPQTILTKQEIMACRLLRGYNRFEFGRLMGYTEGMVRAMERSYIEVTFHTQKKIIQLLKIRKSELEKIREALAGKVDKIEVDRLIPDIVKEQVRKREKNQCAHCDSKHILHFHHIKSFSKGGMHIADNLILLCSECHAEQHVGEVCYALLKSMAKRKPKKSAL